MGTVITRRRLAAASACLLATLAGPVLASCGSAFCSLMSDRYAQGTGAPQVGWSADLRIESVTQDRLRTGTTRLGASQVTGEEAIERRTRNLNVVTRLAYGFDPDWSVSLRVPVVNRDHAHDLVDDQTGLPSTPERWRFTRLGDVQVLARRQRVDDDGHAIAVFGGLKLPTGSTGVANTDGSRAERALQPGTGTTDLVLGVALRRAVGSSDAWMAQAGYQQALNSREGFKPGAVWELSGGWSHAHSQRLGSVVQLNLRHRGHDRGAQAEPANSGSTTLDLSPGITVATGAASTLYAYLQLPLYRKVTGIQIVPRHALALGWTQDF